MSQLSNTIFKSPLLQIGLFRCYRDNPNFTDTGPIQNHILVFPRTSVRIHHRDKPPIVASPNVVMFYNKNQTYCRYPVSVEGDLCEWFAFQADLIIDALTEYDPAVSERLETPFTLTHGPSDAFSYLQQRAIVEHSHNTTPIHEGYIETMALAILERAVGQAYNTQGRYKRPPSQKTEKLHQTLVYEAQAQLARNFQEPLTLTSLADYLHTSVYHLCRIFRRYTGYTLQQYLDQIRLRTALDAILHDKKSLTSIAHDLGYAHHSHFAQAFRKSFGLPPSAFRKSPNLFYKFAQ
ncbi:MAG: helix-turn-helix transcriptional regulator [Chloroflexota bacterium]